MKTQLTPDQITTLNELLAAPSITNEADLLPFYKRALKMRAQLLSFCEHKPTPLFVFDEAAAVAALEEFQSVFKQSLPTAETYFAMKSNDYPALSAALVKHGAGLDVSSLQELEIALATGAQQILFSGPAKTSAELQLALQHSDRVTILIDSFAELEKIGTEFAGKNCSVGVRVYTDIHKRWSIHGLPFKFGISLDELGHFWTQTQQYPHIHLSGIQCHMSWNESPEPYQNVIAIIGNYLEKAPAAIRNGIEFIDLGGGFYPSRVEGYYPWTEDAGKLQELLDSPTLSDYPNKFRVNHAADLKTFSTAIAAAITQHLSVLPTTTRYLFEPGRMLSYPSMHILLQLVDVKSDRHGVTDGGTNMIGWEKYENTFSPLINLTHPSESLIQFTTYGSLCTPHDIWGLYCYAEKMEPGDILLLPYQGAYTYTLRQSFIKGLPRVEHL